MPMIQKVQKEVEVPQVQYEDQVHWSQLRSVCFQLQPVPMAKGMT